MTVATSSTERTSPPGSAPLGPTAADCAPMPRSHGRERRGRRADRHRRGRRRLLAVLGTAVCAIAVVATVTAAVRLDDRSRSDDRAAAVPGPPAGPSAATTKAARALLVQTGSGALQAVTALVVDPSGRGGEVLFLPVGTMVELPAFGLNALRDANAFGGTDLVVASVENLLGVPFGTVGAVDGAALGQAVGPAGPLVVDVPEAVTTVGADGRVQVVFSSGPLSVASDRVADLLALPGEGTDLDRLVRHQAFWQAWLTAVAAAPDTGGPPPGALGGAEEVVRALAAGPVRYRVLPVQAVSTGRGADADLYSVEEALLDGLRDQLLAAGDSAPRIRVQVLNGTGSVSVSRLVQPLLVPAGARVELSGNADSFGYGATQVVFYADEGLEAARTVQAALGVGEVVRSQLDLDVVDVTVVVGADFLAAVAGGAH